MSSNFNGNNGGYIIILGGPVANVPAGQGLTFDPATSTWTVVGGSNPQFIGIDLATEPEKKKHSDGCTCKKCDTFYPYADSPENEKEFTCWACRHGY